MFKSFLRNIKGSTQVVKPTITFYHNSRLPLSNHFLHKLGQFTNIESRAINHVSSNNSRFDLSLESGQLSFNDFKFIINECLDIHPNNKSILRDLLHNDAKFCILEYQKIATPSSQFPIIIDYENKLIANDEKSFDRILANYLSCGIQHLTNGNVRSTLESNYKTKPVGEGNVRDGKVISGDLVHPHVAEFADLF